MGMLEKTNWYAREHDVSISLMRFAVDIDFCVDNSSIIYKVKVIDNDRKELDVNFYAFDDAIDFVLDTVDKKENLAEIVEEYKEQFKAKKYRTKTIGRR